MLGSHWVWLAGLAVIFLVRFPIHFLLEPPYLMDLEVYRVVAQRVLHGGGAHLYAPTTSDLMLFKYAPCWALLWCWLGWGSAHLTAVLWSALNVVWLIAGCRVAHALCAQARLTPPSWLALPIVALLTRPLMEEFLNGQVNLLWALLTMGGWLATVRHRWWTAATCFALAISLKLPAAIVLPYFLLRRQGAVAVRTLGVLLMINGAASLALVPTQPLRLLSDWGDVLVSSGASRAFEIGNQSLPALLGRFLSADRYQLNVLALPLASLFWMAASFSLVLFVLVAIPLGSSPPTSRRLVFDGALLTLLMVLCSPTVWVATYSALLLPVAVAGCCLWRHRASLVSAMAAAGLVLLSLMTHSSFWRHLGIQRIQQESYVFLVLMVLPWFGLALFAYLWRQRRLAAFSRTSRN